MSLRLWLPLNGNVKNQGSSHSSITLTGATVNNSGKIGRCYSFNGSNNYITGTHNFISNNTENWSFCCWVKFNNVSNTMCLFSSRTSASTTGITIFTGSSWLIDDGVRWTLTPKTTISANTWYHVCVTRTKSIKKLYINGVLDSSTTTTGTPSTVCTTNYMIGASQNNATSPSGNYLNGYLNDARFYDHELAKKEIREISKALVLHWPLDAGGRGGINLVLGSNTASTDTNIFGYSEQTGGSTKTIVYDGGVPCIKVTRNSTAHSGWAYMYYNRLNTSALKAGATYTVSMDVIASGSGSISLSAFMNGNATNSLSQSSTTINGAFNSTEWSHLVFRTTLKSSFDGITVGSQCVYMSCGFMNTTNVWIMMKNIKVEEGTKDTPWSPAPSDNTYSSSGLNNNTEYDSSGYQRHGSNSTFPTIDTDSPKYNCSYKYAGSVANAHTNNTTELNFLDQFSWSLWVKTNYTGSTAQYAFTVGRADAGGYGYGLQITSTTGCNIKYGNAGYNVTVTGGQWTHLAFTKSGNTIKIYKNGALYSTNTFSGTAPTYSDGAGVGVGCFHYTGNIYPYYGNLSDFRIYSSCLTDADIKDLYTTLASVTKNGSIMTFDFNE